MFNLRDLQFLRDEELRLLATYLPSSGRILEVGAGTGYQARALARLGFEVQAIDLPSSSYSAARVFPVEDYDGLHFPFDAGTFDVVFSSNVLEHVHGLPQVLSEVRRVLRPNGYAVHAMPTTAWRFWTTMLGPLDAVPYVFATAFRGLKRQGPPGIEFLKRLAGHYLPLAHGDSGNALTELWTFRRRHWIKRFEENGFEVMWAAPVGLFYTGRCFAGRRVSVRIRRQLARVAGSACIVYQVRPI